ncbi:MAG TPA: hypothetical protein VGL91_19300 [Acidobacteriota bacterium]|jgi:hypothetical protein
MKQQTKFTIGPLLVELVIYALLVTLYFFLVLYFLGGWIKQLFDQHKTVYAFVSLALIVGQGFLLEILTAVLMKRVRWR